MRANKEPGVCEILPEINPQKQQVVTPWLPNFFDDAPS